MSKKLKIGCLYRRTLKSSTREPVFYRCAGKVVYILGNYQYYTDKKFYGPTDWFLLLDINGNQCKILTVDGILGYLYYSIGNTEYIMEECKVES